ncbi:putative membrane protein [Acinetobacter sp. 983759]|nr:putative membrane protein [Acinetobacter sp. 983759]
MPNHVTTLIFLKAILTGFYMLCCSFWPVQIFYSFIMVHILI